MCKKINKAIVPAFFSFLLCGSLYAEVITEITVLGLTRTNARVPEKVLEKFYAMDAAEVNSGAVEASILDTGILEPVSVEITPASDGSGQRLTVTVREKWTIFPLPLFIAGSNGITVGGAFMEANAFGINDKAILAGFYSSSGWMAFATYAHSAVKGEAPGWSVSGTFARNDSRDANQTKEDLRRYGLDTIAGSMGINYPVTDSITLSGALTFNDKILRTSDNPLNAPEKGAITIGLQPEIRFRTSDWDGYLLSEQSASLEYNLMIGIDSPTVQRIDFRARYEKSLVPGLKLLAHTGGAYSPYTTTLFEVSPSSVTNILPTSFSAWHYAGAQAGFEKYIHKWAQGTLSLLAAYQAVYSWGPLLEGQWDYGFSGAMGFYLARLAIPAVGLGFSYNMRVNYWQGNFSIGMSF